MKSKILMIACTLAVCGTAHAMEMPIEHLNQQLWLAVQQNNATQVATLLQNKDINVNIQDANQWTLLHRAVFHGNREIIKLLLADPRIDVNLKDSYGSTPLHRSIAENWLKIIPFEAPLVENIEIVKLLLDHPAVDVNAEHCYKIYAEDDCYKRDTAFQKACGKNEGEFFPVKNKEALIQLLMNHCDHSSAAMQKSKKLLTDLQADKTYFALLPKDLLEDMLAPYLHCKSVTDEAALEILKDRTINPSIKAVIKSELEKRSPLPVSQEEDTELILTGKHVIKVPKNNKKNNKQNCSIS